MITDQNPDLDYKKHLERHGYVIIPDILDDDEIIESTKEFHKWRTSIPNLDNLHNLIEVAGIYKYHEVGHQRFAWLLRTNDKIINVFKKLWDTDELVCSFDGSCYYPSNYIGEETYWTHCDQSPLKRGLQCYQSFISLTSNKERTFVVYDGSHKLNDEYNELYKTDEPSEFNVINKNYVDTIQYRKKLLSVKAGSLVIWDSRTFHQNTCGPSDCVEERIVQYLCYLPKNDERNTQEEQEKRREYFRSYKTTPHLPYPITAIPKQSHYYTHYEFDHLYINYSQLVDPDIDDLIEKIERLL